jgi:spoIIIJ-associated protein
MEEERSIEISAADAEAAIRHGLAQLGVGREQVEITVLNEGSRGILGLGSRPAIVRLTLKPGGMPAPAPVREPEPQVVPVAAPAPMPRPMPPVVQEMTRPPVAAGATQAMGELEDEAQAEREMLPPLDRGQAEQVARDTLSELLNHMQIEGRLESHWVEPTEPDSMPTLVLDVFGDDLGVLIGRRGETLDALQMIARLIVSRELERRVSLTIDVENYRVRREQTLRQLAQRMAEQAVQRRRRVSLEPMPAYERRIVHMELRNHAQVVTESVGDGDERKVTIIPRELRRGRR